MFNEQERAFVKTLGPVPAAACPDLYADADAVFLPTLLECFSANYPEAMVMRKPILTSDLSFATGLLGSSAIYFDPLDASDIAQKILQLSHGKDIYNAVVAKALNVLPNFIGPAERASCLVSLCERVSDRAENAPVN
jgi:glycosyltransferase involved in cell wall biosynthesis